MPGESQKEPRTGEPDPSTRAMEQLLLQIENARALTDAQFETAEVRTALLHERLEGLARRMDVQVSALHDLVDERHAEQKASVAAAFAASDTAVNAALQAAERAVIKAEASTEKRLDSERKLLDNQIAEIRQQLFAIEDLKANERLQVERVESLRREAAALRDASDKAITKTESSMEKRFEAVNEFRGQLSDQASRFVSKDEYSASHSALGEKVQALQGRLDRSEGSDEGVKATGGTIAAVIGAVAAIIVIVNVLIFLFTK